MYDIMMQLLSPLIDSELDPHQQLALLFQKNLHLDIQRNIFEEMVSQATLKRAAILRNYQLKLIEKI